ncbi:MAG: response regulator [Minwuiales bacterium]|nr:response regulator [Minwuiales bacterium]
MEPRKHRILFVDDERNVLEGLQRQFRDRRDSWDLSFESTPAGALDLMRTRPADVVVSDMQMPGMTGLEMVVAMRQWAPQSAYIMLTGTADLETAMGAINQAAIFRFYTKPCPPGLLAEGIEAGLAASASGRPSSKPSAVSRPNITESIGLAALNQLALSVIVTDRNGRVLLTNRSGGALLSDADGLMLSAGEICRAASPSETAGLHDLIRAVTDKSATDCFDVDAIALARPSMKRPLSLLVAPLAAVDEDAGRLAVLFVTDPERNPLASSDSIAKLFGLTNAEARLTHALAGGHRLEDAAKHCGITVSTARTYLKQVFGKTDTNRQSELIKLVLTYPALAPDGAE